MLDERKANILRAVVEEYIETAQPVGSAHIVDAPGVNVSSATVRNDMVYLEQEGFLAHPHTSAGRVPTEKGYRFFVDHLAVPGRLDTTDAQQVRSFFAKAHGELEGMLQDTTRLLSDLTRYAAVVIGPPNETATVRSIQLVGLAPCVALMVVVLSNGAVTKHTMEFDDDVDEMVLTQAGAVLSGDFVGRPLGDVPPNGWTPVSDGRADAVVVAARALLNTPEHDGSVFIGGTSEMVSAFDAVGTVSEILRILEQQFVVVTLLRDVVDRGLNVAIGTETGIDPLVDCSLVVSPYQIDGEVAGSIGVLGPTRMNYPQALAAVAVVGDRLSRRLSDS